MKWDIILELSNLRYKEKWEVNDLELENEADFLVEKIMGGTTELKREEFRDSIRLGGKQTPW